MDTGLVWDRETLVKNIQFCEEQIEENPEGISHGLWKYNLRFYQSECIRLGYGERDTDGNFRLKEME